MPGVAARPAGAAEPRPRRRAAAVPPAEPLAAPRPRGSAPPGLPPAASSPPEAPGLGSGAVQRWESSGDAAGAALAPQRVSFRARANSPGCC